MHAILHIEESKVYFLSFDSKIFKTGGFIMLSYIMIVLMGLLGGIPSLVLTLGIPVVIIWKFHRKLRFGYTMYQ